MLTASEYINMTDQRKREFALAVDELERMCAEAVSLYRRMLASDVTTTDGRISYERWESALLCKRNDIYARQTEYHMGGICVTLASDDRGMPIRVRRPLGFKGVEALMKTPSKTKKE